MHASLLLRIYRAGVSNFFASSRARKIVPSWPAVIYYYIREGEVRVPGAISLRSRRAVITFSFALHRPLYAPLINNCLAGYQVPQSRPARTCALFVRPMQLFPLERRAELAIGHPFIRAGEGPEGRLKQAASARRARILRTYAHVCGSDEILSFRA